MGTRTDPDGPGWTRTNLNRPRWTRTDLEGPERTRTDPDGPGRTQTDPDGPGQARTDLNRPRWTLCSYWIQTVLPDFGTNDCGIRIGDLESEDIRTFSLRYSMPT